MLGGTDDSSSDFTGANMRCGKMAAADFVNANLADTGLDEAYRTDVDFNGATFSAAAFDGIGPYTGLIWTGATYVCRNARNWESSQAETWRSANRIVT